MIFAISIDREGNGPGMFTSGKLYLAMLEIEESTVVDVGHVTIEDDNGDSVVVEPDQERFAFPEEVYGVVVQKVGKKWPGEVVVVDGADGEFLSVKGVGYIRLECLQLLDMVIVRPGMMVYDREKCRWDVVLRVDDRLMLTVENREGSHEPTDFRFAVLDGDLAMVPLVRCQGSMEGLTEGALYREIGIVNGDVVVVDDAGEERAFPPHYFASA